MKTIIAFILAISSSLANAKGPDDPRGAAIANMFAHCSCVMDLGTCAGYAEARASMPPAQVNAPRLLGLLGTVPAGYWYDWNANPAMCAQLVTDCRTSFDSDGCRIARSQFRQTEYDCRGTRTADAAQAQDTLVPLAAGMFSLLALAAMWPRRRPRFIKQ